MNEPMTSPLTLSTLGKGGLEELFQQQLRVVLDNIQDPTCDAEAARGITIAINFKPSKTRESAALEFKVTSKLAPWLPEGSIVYIAADPDGQLAAVEFNPRQAQLFPPPEPQPGVVRIETRKEQQP